MIEFSSYFAEFEEFIHGQGFGLNKQGMLNFAEISARIDAIGAYNRSVLELTEALLEAMEYEPESEDRNISMAQIGAYQLLIQGFNREMIRKHGERYLEFRLDESRSCTHIQTIKDFFISLSLK